MSFRQGQKKESDAAMVVHIEDWEELMVVHQSTLQKEGSHVAVEGNSPCNLAACGAGGVMETSDGVVSNGLGHPKAEDLLHESTDHHEESGQNGQEEVSFDHEVEVSCGHEVEFCGHEAGVSFCQAEVIFYHEEVESYAHVAGVSNGHEVVVFFFHREEVSFFHEEVEFYGYGEEAFYGHEEEVFSFHKVGVSSLHGEVFFCHVAGVSFGHESEVSHDQKDKIHHGAVLHGRLSDTPEVSHKFHQILLQEKKQCLLSAFHHRCHCH